MRSVKDCPMGDDQKDEEKATDDYSCDKCHSTDVVFVENEYIMGREIKKYLCEHCGSNFFISRD